MARRAETTPWLAEGEEKREAVQAMFSDIAPTYDLLNSLMSFRLHKRWRATAVRKLELHSGDQVLDVCCGTGDFLVPLSNAVGDSGTVIGLDFAPPMLERAKPKSKSALFLGDACRLPFLASSFQAVSVGWGLRNVPNLDTALKEIIRVLRPGGRFVSLDMSRPKGILGWISERVFVVGVPLLGRIFGKSAAYTYLPKSTAQFVAPSVMAEKLTALGLQDVRYRLMFFGNVCLHWGVKPL